MVMLLYLTLMFTVPCAAHLASARWQVAYKIQVSLLSQEYYQKDGIKSEKQKTRTKWGTVRGMSYFGNY
jgi:hypothetical protein